MTSTGRRARVRDIDGIADVEAVAREISARTGIPIGMAPDMQRSEPTTGAHDA